MAYYVTIDGIKMDKDLIDAADEAVKGRGDGRISMEDATILLEKVKDGNSYTDVEKDTMEYVRKKYTWTYEANEWFKTEIRKWAASK